MRSPSSAFGVLFLASILLASCDASQRARSESATRPPLRAGVYRGWLDSPGGELPFGLELEAAGDAWRAVLINPPERISVARARVTNGELVLDMDPYDSTLRAHPSADGTRLEGTWRKRRSADAWVELRFHAALGVARRFTVDAARAAEASIKLPERWAVRLASDPSPAVAVLESHEDGTVSGTFLTNTGDLRYLAGNLDGSRLRLSCFDGAHAFLFDARLTAGSGDPASAAPPSPVLRGDFWSGDGWHDTWEARPDPSARLEDPFAQSRWTERASLSELRFPDLQGQLHALDDPAFAGRARILQVFGSWCPNCNDEARYLVELDRKYRARGLHILGLAFEVTGDLAQDAEQVRRFAAHHHVEYPLLVAGLADKDAASKQFPLLDRVRAYPTTIFLHGDGRLRAVHTGFAGPATGSAHTELRREFEAILEELLAEPQPGTREPAAAGRVK